MQDQPDTNWPRALARKTIFYSTKSHRVNQVKFPILSSVFDIYSGYIPSCKPY